MTACRYCGRRTQPVERMSINRVIEAQDNGGIPLCGTCFRGRRS